jgi:DUF1009 family protein
MPTTSLDQKTIGLIAGNRQFPFLFARAARDQGYKIIAAGVAGDTSPLLHLFVDKFQYFKVGELKKLFAYFRENQVSEVIMAGQVNQDNLFNPNVCPARPQGRYHFFCCGGSFKQRRHGLT